MTAGVATKPLEAVLTPPPPPPPPLPIVCLQACGEGHYSDRPGSTACKVGAAAASGVQQDRGGERLMRSTRCQAAGADLSPPTPHAARPACAGLPLGHLLLPPRLAALRCASPATPAPTRSSPALAPAR